jgi:sulfane dehydrogenase subunit SoxC
MSLKKSSRRVFLRQGATLAAATAAGITAASGQGFSQDPKLRTDFVPEDQVPKDHVWRDPWTGEMMRDEEGNLVVDWTGTPQWDRYRKNAQEMGKGYGTLEVDSRLYGIRSRFVKSYRRGLDGGSAFGFSGTPTAPSANKTYFFSLLTPVETQLGVITPAGLHYADEHAEVPEIDPRAHRLTIFGMVDRPITLTMDELMDMPSVSRIHTLECNTNGVTGGLRNVPWATPGHCFGEGSCSEWTGVLMSTLMDAVGVKKEAKWFYASAGDEYNQTWAVPVWKAADDAMIAYGQNGEPLRPEQGFPIRLLCPGFQGTSNIKRIRRIKFTDDLTLFHRMYEEVRPSGKVTWFRLEMPPQSCILKPSGGQKLTRKGFYEVRGVAWSGAGKITRVEVTVDGGRTWKDAVIQGPENPKAHTRFVYPWNWNGQQAVIASRCTDEKGSVQPTTPEAAKSRGMSIEDFKTRNLSRNNIPQAWRIGGDGKVTNAIFSI